MKRPRLLVVVAVMQGLTGLAAVGVLIYVLATANRLEVIERRITKVERITKFEGVRPRNTTKPPRLARPSATDPALGLSPEA